MKNSPEPTSAGAMTGSLALIGVATLLRKLVDHALGEVDLSIRHVSVLGHVRARPGVSMTELARRVNVTAQSMHATTHDLIRAGLLTSEAPLRRGRSGALRITDEGAARLDQALQIVARVDEELGLERLDSDALMRVALDIVRRTD